MWGNAAQFPRCQDSSLVVARLSEGQRGKGAVLALEGHHLAVPDEKACEQQEWSLPFIMRGRQDPMSTSGKL